MHLGHHWKSHATVKRRCSYLVTIILVHRIRIAGVCCATARVVALPLQSDFTGYNQGMCADAKSMHDTNGLIRSIERHAQPATARMRRSKMHDWCAVLPCSSDTKICLLVVICVSVLGYVATLHLIPTVAQATLRNGIHGRDINKAGTIAGSANIPEATGLAAAGVYLACIVVLQLFSCYCSWRSRNSWPSSQVCEFNSPQGPVQVEKNVGAGDGAGHGRKRRQQERAHEGTQAGLLAAAPAVCTAGIQTAVPNYSAVLATVGMMAFVGFVDDVLNPPPLTWAFKAVPAFFAFQPVLVSAYLRRRPTAAVKQVLQTFLGLPATLDFGIWYYIYLNVGASFVPNSINILAGINGLEAGQVLVISCAVLMYNLMQICESPHQQQYRATAATTALAGASSGKLPQHLLSFCITAPLAATTVALLQFNWYPSKVFVGDTFPYFAGTVIAAAAIIGQFTCTLFIFLLPQFFNAMYSLPQLFRFVACPAFRMPVFDASTGLMQPKSRSDLNLQSLMVQLFGPCSEQTLCIRLLMLQGACCVLGLWLTWRRHRLFGCAKCA